MCFAWFSATGGSAVLAEIDGAAGGRLVATEHAFRIYAAVDLLMPESVATAIKAALAGLFLILIVASSTAAILAIKAIGAAGSALGETRLHSAMWAVVIAAMTGAVIGVGGVGSIRNVMIVGALPFSVILALMLPSVLLMMSQEARGPETGTAPAHPRRALRAPDPTQQTTLT
jgi:choline-glycine betaine transporter